MITNNLNTNINVANSKVLLVIDWSNLMFRSLYIHKIFGHVVSGYELEEDLKSFTNKFAVDVCSVINMFNPSNIIIATDGQHAWRKNILPGTDGYKSNRDKDPNVNWENIYKCSDDLLEILRKRNMHVANVEHAEADDIIALIKEDVFEKHPDYNIIIVSADADIRQLISFNKETKQFCVVYNTTGRGKNSNRRMYVTKEFMDWYNEPEVNDIFFTSFDPQKYYVKELIRTNSIIELYPDNPNMVVLNKILCGDDGDNVPSFYGYYKNGKLIRITPLKAKKILEQTGSDSVQSLVENINKMPDALDKICKKHVDDIDYNERLLRQRQLVELNSEMFPKYICDYKETIDYMVRNCSGTSFQNMRAQELLKGTEYEGANKKKALTAAVFSDLEKKLSNTRPLDEGMPIFI